MRHTLRFATVVAAALAFTACSDSAHRGPTEPDGARFSSHLSNLNDGQVALLSEILTVQQTLYDCVKNTGRSNQKQNKTNDINTMGSYANAGQWNDVATKANQIINDTKGLVQNGAIPVVCPGYGGISRTQLASELYLLLELFASQGEFLDETTGFVACPSGGCEEVNEEWGVNVPPGTFGQSVAILVRQNVDVPAPGNYNPVGNSFHFDVFPASAVANNPWTRCIVWEGYDPDNELPDVGLVQMVRQDEDGVEELPTQAQVNACGDQETETASFRNPLVRGAYALFAGFPFLPKELHAYSPPRTFGGTSLKSSPHWLVVGEPDFSGTWNGRAAPASNAFDFSVTLIVESQDGETITGEYRVGDCGNPAPCASVAYNFPRDFTGTIDGNTFTFTLAPFNTGINQAIMTLTLSEGELIGTQVVHRTNNTIGTFNLTLERGESEIVTAPTVD